MSNTGYRNGEIAGNPRSVYSELKNRDIAPVPHTKRQELGEYFLRKRESYRAVRAFDQLDLFRGYRFTDVRDNDDRGCGSNDECCKLYYGVSQDKTRYIIVRAGCDDCTPTVIKCGSRCPCAEMKFFKVYGRNSPILNDTTNRDYSIASIRNENTFGRALIEKDISKNVSGPIPGDYIQIIGVTQDGNAICGGIRQVIFVEARQGNGDWAYKVQLSTPWSGIAGTDVLTGAKVISFQEVDRVPGFVTDKGIQTIVGCAKDVGWNCNPTGEGLPIGDTLCDIGLSSCIVSAHQHNGTLTYLNDKGYSYYGGIGYDSNQPNNNNVQFVGSDKIDSTSFKNFIINFGRKELNAIVFNETGTVSYLKELETHGIGIKNKGAWAQFDGGLFFVGTDNRIYGTSITSNGQTFDIDMKDITTNIRSHMDLLREDDEVYMSSDAGVMYIFINSRSSDKNSNTNTTKILKYYKDFEIRGPWHEVCGEVITGLKYGQFLGRSIYNYCGRDGDGEAVKPYTDEYGETKYYGKGYEAVAEGLIYGMNQHGITSQDGVKANMFRKHQLVRGTMLLGGGVYTKATKIQTSRASKYIREQSWNIDDTNPWITNRKQAWNCQPVSITDCFLEGFSSCDNMKNPCKDSEYNCKTVDKRCKCEGRRIDFDDFCICYDDASYNLAPVEAFETKFDDNRARYHKVRFVSGFNRLEDEDGRYYHVNDIGYFGGMIIETNSENGFFVDLESFSSGCCNKEPECPINSCS